MAASCGQSLQERAVPRGARTWRGLAGSLADVREAVIDCTSLTQGRCRGRVPRLTVHLPCRWRGPPG